MPKSLYPSIDWNSIKAVGFDLDGTLYDELDFIAQVYKPISEYLAQVCSGNHSDIYNWMLRRWREKGSSYNHIFDEVLIDHGVEKNMRDSAIAECLVIFRTFKPTLVLPERSRLILDSFSEKFDLFLITDGSVSLQSAKIAALDLQRWFKTENTVITGRYGKLYSKPSALCIGNIKVLCEKSPKEVVFVGDRDVDLEFAQNAGFHFIAAKSLGLGKAESL